MHGCPVSVGNVGYWEKYGEVWRQNCNGLYWASTECSEIWNGYMEGAVRAGEKAVEDLLKK